MQALKMEITEAKVKKLFKILYISLEKITIWQAKISILIR
jgi:hypothetical protein